MAHRYQISVPTTPGAIPVEIPIQGDLRAARRAAGEYRTRRDLTYQDVRIERKDGSLVEYAGPLH